MESKNMLTEKKKSEISTRTKQLSLLGTKEFPSFEEIIFKYSKEFYNYITPKGDNVFGFWMQTLADLELLKLELEGLTNKYEINFIERK